MDNYTQIEQYLEGTLSPAEQATLTARMANDPGFKAEVALHGQLQEALEDPHALRLQDILQDIVAHTPTPVGLSDENGPMVLPNAPLTSSNARKWIWLLLLALLFALGIWRWFAVPAAPEVKNPQQISTPPTAPEIPSEQQEQPIAQPQRPIAQARPNAFAPNQQFERRLGSSGIRASADDTVVFYRPAMGAAFTPRRGITPVHFEGLASADADTARFPLVLSIYNNQENPEKPLRRFLPTITNRGAELWTFSDVQPLPLPSGLYYFVLERRATGSLLYVGKFTVGGGEF